MSDQANPCPVCEFPLQSPPINLDRGTAPKLGFEIPCEWCGRFLIGIEISGMTNWLNQDPERRLRLSHALCWLQRGAEPPNLSMEIIEKLAKTPLPELPQQVDRLILWLGRTLEPGQKERLHPRAYRTVVGAKSVDAVRFLLNYLTRMAILEGDLNTNQPPYLRLTFEGWQRYTEITRGAKGSKRAFMAMKFTDEELNQFVDDHFRPAVGATGFELFRLDDDPQAGLIDNQMRVEIRRARFLIADLSHENLGAYWEAGFAEGLGKPVIYTCREGKTSHFDTNHCQTVFWNPEKPEEAARKLKDSIRVTLPAEALMEDPPSEPATRLDS